MPSAAHLRAPPARPSKFSTKNINEAAEALNAIYSGQAQIDYLGAKKDFGFNLSFAAFGALRLFRWSISGMSQKRPADAEMHIGFPIEGELSGQSGSHRIESSCRARGFSIRADESYACSVAFARGVTLRTPPDVLQLRAEILTGKHYGPSLLDGMVREIDLGSPIAAILSKTMQTALVEAANLQTVGMGGLASAGYEDLLLNLTVAVLFPQVAAAMGHASPDCGPAVISAVRDYIRACAGEVVEMSVVASRFNISMRAMQENFRRYYGFSPRDYLTECRLDRAHQSLLAADGSKSISEVVEACGFSDYKHFSAKYRDKYGELPSETLRVASR